MSDADSLGAAEDRAKTLKLFTEAECDTRIAAAVRIADSRSNVLRKRLLGFSFAIGFVLIVWLIILVYREWQGLASRAPGNSAIEAEVHLLMWPLLPIALTIGGSWLLVALWLARLRHETAVNMSTGAEDPLLKEYRNLQAVRKAVEDKESEVWSRPSRSVRVLNDKTLWKLATTRMFVHDAQYRLEIRAFTLYFMAFVSMVLILYAASIGFLYTSHALESLKLLDFYDAKLPKESSAPILYFSLKLLGTSGVMFFIALIVAHLAYFMRASLHEGTVLLHRRHALRFGKLAVFLDSDIHAKDLADIFQWNREPETQFARTPKEPTPIVIKALETIGKVATRAKDEAEEDKKK